MSKLTSQSSALSLKKVVSKVSDWMQEVYFTKRIFPSLRRPMRLHFTLLKRKSLIPLQETLVKPRLLDCAKVVLDNRACNKLKQVSLFNDTIKSGIKSKTYFYLELTFPQENVLSNLLAQKYGLQYQTILNFQPPLPLNGNLRNTSHMKKIPNYEL